MKDYEEFFNTIRGYSISAIFYENRYDFEIEDLYQAFKARYEAEKEGNPNLEDGFKDD